MSRKKSIERVFIDDRNGNSQKENCFSCMMLVWFYLHDCEYAAFFAVIYEEEVCNKTNEKRVKGMEIVKITSELVSYQSCELLYC